VGKRKNPAYKMCLAYVRGDIHEVVMRALGDRGVRAAVIADLDEAEVEHLPGKAAYSDLVELLLLRWLEETGWEPDEGAGGRSRR
jgi:hypothetical protein